MPPSPIPPGSNFLGATGDRLLIVDKATPLAILGQPDTEHVGILSCNIASTISRCTYSAGVPGNYFLFGPSKPWITNGAPLLATFKDGSDNHAILAFKTVGMGEVYAYGIPIPVLKGWKPLRSHSEEMKEEGLLVSTKLSDGKIGSLTLLKKTDSHDLPAMVDHLMSFMPSFQNVKIKGITDAKKYCEEHSFEKNAGLVLLAMEKNERKIAKEKGARSREAADSVAGGQDAGARWRKAGDALKSMAEYYGAPFEKRFILIAVGEDGQPTAEAVEAVKADFKCAQGKHTPTLISHVCSLSLRLIYFPSACALHAGRMTSRGKQRCFPRWTPLSRTSRSRRQSEP